MYVVLVVDLKVKPGEIYKGEPKANKADCTLTLEDEDMVALVNTIFSKVFLFKEMKLSFLCLGYW